MRLTSSLTFLQEAGSKSAMSGAVKTAAADWERPMARTGDCAGGSNEAEGVTDAPGGDSAMWPLSTWRCISRRLRCSGSRSPAPGGVFGLREQLWRVPGQCLKKSTSGRRISLARSVAEGSGPSACRGATKAFLEGACPGNQRDSSAPVRNRCLDCFPEEGRLLGLLERLRASYSWLPGASGLLLSG